MKQSIAQAKEELRAAGGCVGDLFADREGRVWVVCDNKRGGRDNPFKVSDGTKQRLWSNRMVKRDLIGTSDLFQDASSSRFNELACRFVNQVSGFFQQTPDHLVDSADGDSHPHPMRRGGEGQGPRSTRAPYPQE